MISQIMLTKYSNTIFGILAAIVTSLIIMSNQAANVLAQSSIAEPQLAKDSIVLFLEGKTIPAGDFIPIYSTVHYVIIPGHATIIVHILAKLPCDADSKSPIQMLVGHIPIIKVIQPNLVPELSTTGMCLYNLDLGSKPGVANSQIITDVVLKNPTDKAITFPPSSTVILSVNEVRPAR
jgi:hypothetical protein